MTHAISYVVYVARDTVSKVVLTCFIMLPEAFSTTTLTSLLMLIMTLCKQ